MDFTRRSFLSAMAGALALAPRLHSRSLHSESLPHPPGGRLGLELYRVRNELKSDLAGTLKLVRDWGFEQVELAGFPPMSAEQAARRPQTAGLRAGSHFFG